MCVTGYESKAHGRYSPSAADAVANSAAKLQLYFVHIKASGEA